MLLTIYELFVVLQIDYPELQQAALYTLGCAAERNRKILIPEDPCLQHFVTCSSKPEEEFSLQYDCLDILYATTPPPCYSHPSQM